VSKITKKTVWRSAFFVILALKIRCRIVKNTLYRWLFRFQRNWTQF